MRFNTEITSVSGTPVIIRRVTRDDLPVVIDLLANDALGWKREDAGGPLPKAYIEAFERIDSDANQALVVADLDGRVVGCMQLTFIPGLTYTGGTRLQIEGVRVHEDLRGHGLGAAMMNWAIDTAREENCCLVQLTTDLRRPVAKQFYEKLGFKHSHAGMKMWL